MWDPLPLFRHTGSYRGSVIYWVWTPLPTTYGQGKGVPPKVAIVETTKSCSPGGYSKYFWWSNHPLKKCGSWAVERFLPLEKNIKCENHVKPVQNVLQVKRKISYVVRPPVPTQGVAIVEIAKVVGGYCKHFWQSNHLLMLWFSHYGEISGLGKE